MIGLVIVTHGQLAKAFVEALEYVVGSRENIRAICIYPEDNVDEHRENILKTVEQVDRGQGVILLTDLFGGTPSNLAISALGVKPVEVIAGINLPMLVRLARLPEGTPLKEAVAQGQEAGRKYIHAASALLESKILEPTTKDQRSKKTA
ncbi:MAG: system fructose subfamily component [Alphaproteobacteria bacterium]|jgi:PTS system mannose-specific IIA component|nr:system fructose subfamily component [Alphaproteobacteria bacterium]